MNAQSAIWAEHHLPSAPLRPTRRALIRSVALIGAFIALAVVLSVTREPLALVIIPLGLPLVADAVPELLARKRRRSELVATPGALEFRMWPVVHRIAYEDLVAVTVRPSPWSLHPRIVTHLVGGAVAEFEVTRGADREAPWPDFMATLLAAHGHRLRMEDLVRLRALVPGAAPRQGHHDVLAGDGAHGSARQLAVAAYGRFMRRRPESIRTFVGGTLIVTSISMLAAALALPFEFAIQLDALAGGVALAGVLTMLTRRVGLEVDKASITRISGPFRTRASLADAVSVHPVTKAGDTVLRVTYADGRTREIPLDGMVDGSRPWGPAVLLACQDNGIAVEPEAQLWLAGHASA